MSSIKQNPGDTNIYLYVESSWYRYDSTAEPLGEGAMGIVWMGFNCDSGEKVAIKQIRPELCGIPMIRARAKLEATLVVNHPHVVRMLGYCEDSPSEGPLYIISEYVSGITMAEHVETQLARFSVEERDRKIAQEFLPVVDAVGALHAQGIIHRDIKPSNIMLQDGYLPKLMDLGIAKADRFFDAHLCGTIGSPPFAAPEQIVPDNVESVVDARSDIYSLGVTLSYLAGSKYPLDAYVHSAKLVDIITVATAKKPEDRFSDTAQLKEALEDYISDLSDEAETKNAARHTYSLPLMMTGALIAILAIILIVLCH